MLFVSLQEQNTETTSCLLQNVSPGDYIIEVRTTQESPIIFIFFKFYWSIVDLQCCINFCFTAKWLSYTYIYSFLFNFKNFLATLHGVWDFSSLTRDWTHAPCSGSMEPQTLDRQGIPYIFLFTYLFIYLFIHSFIYLLAASGLSCSTWDLSFWRVSFSRGLQSAGSRARGPCSCGTRAL